MDLSAGDIEAFSPETLALLDFKSAGDSALVAKLHSHFSALGKSDWKIKYRRELDMTNDALELYEYHIEKLAESVSSPTKWILAEAKMLGEIGKIKPYPEYPPMVETLIEYIANSDNNLDPLEVEMQNKIMKAVR
jgi:hypothetical protein